jgi:hypothetical protein
VKPWGNKNPREFVFDYPHLKGRPGFQQEQRKNVVTDLEEEILPGEDLEPKQSSMGTQHESVGHKMVLRSNNTTGSEKDKSSYSPSVLQSNENNMNEQERDNSDDDKIRSLSDESDESERVRSDKIEIMKKAGLQGIITSDHNYVPSHENPSQNKSGTVPQDVSLYDMMNTSEDRVEVNPVVEGDDVVIQEAPTIEISTEKVENNSEEAVEPEIIYSLRSRDVRKV